MHPSIQATGGNRKKHAFGAGMHALPHSGQGEMVAPALKIFKLSASPGPENARIDSLIICVIVGKMMYGNHKFPKIT